MNSSRDVLYIKPTADPSPQPVIDELTRKMTAACRLAIPSQTPGVSPCKCGVIGDSYEYGLRNGLRTHSLCIHYLAFHRDEIPTVELEKVRQLDCWEDVPEPLELLPPDFPPACAATFDGDGFPTKRLTTEQLTEMKKAFSEKFHPDGTPRFFDKFREKP